MASRPGDDATPFVAEPECQQCFQAARRYQSAGPRAFVSARGTRAVRKSMSGQLIGSRTTTGISRFGAFFW